VAYDPDNVFAKILRGEIPCRKILETDYSLAFFDIEALAPVHALVIPKGPYASWSELCEKADLAEIADLVRAAARVAQELDIADSGYRVLANSGADAGQEVGHLHLHVFGGADLGRMIDVPSGRAPAG
jgi:histidine triad (HIT) family protein